MRITDELREFIEDKAWTENNYAKAIAIADRIDAEHEWACKESYASGAEHSIGASIEASMIEEHGWLRLPVDADGEYIHIGDVLQWPEDGDTFEVVGIGENGALFYFDPDTEGEFADWTASQNKRHYHATTIEDVLREFAQRWDEPMRYDRDEMVEQYAAKLKLADDGEELQ